MSRSTTIRDVGFVESFGSFGTGRTDDDVDAGMPRKYFGKYRGQVVTNVDPEKRGRLLVQVADVLGPSVSSWAMPCLPFAGLQMGFYAVPPPNAGVWVEFEQGDPDFPIWTGFWWGSTAEVPANALPVPPGTPAVVLQSFTQNTLALSDVPLPAMLLQGPNGGIALRAGASTVTIDSIGVTITAPKIEINGVTIVNKGALTVSL